MTRALAALLVLASTLLGPTSAVAEARADGTDSALQAEMDRLFALRTVDPAAFVAQTRSLEAMPPPVSVVQREFLQFLQANRATPSKPRTPRKSSVPEAAADPEEARLLGAFLSLLGAATLPRQNSLQHPCPSSLCLSSPLPHCLCFLLVPQPCAHVRWPARPPGLV